MVVAYEIEGNINCSWCAWNSPQKFGEKTGGIGNQWKNRNPPDYSITEIGQNTEKSWRLEETATQIAAKGKQPRLVRKTRKEW